MADVKESALTQQSDCKWVRALDANGNSIRISKEDLASVVGRLIGTATSDKAGLMPSLAYSSTSVYNMTTYILLKLFSVNEPWMRKHAVVEYGGTSDNGYAMVSAVNKDGLIECNLFVQGSIYPLEFYQKDNSIFLYANQTGTYSKAFIRSCDLIVAERIGSTDMSGYTKISQS